MQQCSYTTGGTARSLGDMLALFVTTPGCAGKAFPDYNMAAYIQRRVLPAVQQRLDGAVDDAALQSAVAAAEQDAAVWERQSVIYGLYQRPHKPILVRAAAHCMGATCIV